MLGGRRGRYYPPARFKTGVDTAVQVAEVPPYAHDTALTANNDLHPPFFILNAHIGAY